MRNTDKEGVILHLFGWDKKFAPQFISFVQDHFPEQQHRFLVYGDVKADELPVGDSVTHYKSLLRNIVPLSTQLRNARKIILHGLFSSHLYYVLSLHAWLLKKSYWVIWGGDLYVHNNERKDWRWQKDEFFRRFVIRRLGHLVTQVRGDYELARMWYGAKGCWHDCFVYPTNLYPDYGIQAIAHNGTNILVGNSAASSNNHIDVLKKLSRYRDEAISIYVPLSYGNRSYAEEVLAYGNAVFGEKFIPLLDFMPFQQYLDLLARIDIAVFNHRRQQAMGNMTTLLGLGKRVFMRPDVTSWSFFTELGVSLFDVEALDIELISQAVASRNQKLISENFSEKRLTEQLERIFQ